MACSAIASLRHATTTPSFLSHLPNDILAEIFSLASESKTSYGWSENGRRRDVRMLATFVFVCHAWRGIVHNTPSLWAYISSDHPYKAHLECLTRSDQSLLHISFKVFGAILQEFRTEIFQEVHRWKSVELCHATPKLLEELEWRPAPLLERLYVKGRVGYPETRNLFHGNTSRLRHLTLLDIQIPWDSNLLSHLTTLYIKISYKHDLSVQEVMQVLQSCPDLISFRLHLHPELHPSPIPLETSTVGLPRLKRLSMRVHSLMTEHLLQRMRIPSCKSLDIEQFDATGPTFSASRNHLIPSLSSILLAASRVSIDIGSTFLEYRVTAKINQDYDGDEDDEGEGEDGEDDMMVKCIRIHASGDQFTGSFAMETLSWLLDNLHTPSFSLPVSLTIGEPDSSALIIERLPSTITYLELCLSGASAKTIVSYLAEPFNAVIDGMATLRWPLPNLTNISFQRCNDIEPEVILGCIQRRAGRGLSSEGRREHREELPAKLTRLRLPRGSSITELKRVFPDCIEWGGPELELAREERRNRYIRSEEIISDSDE